MSVGRSGRWRSSAVRPAVGARLPRAGGRPDRGTDFTEIVSLYAEPNAERVTSGTYDQYASLAFKGDSIVFGLMRVRMSLFSEARFKYRSLSDRRLFGSPDLSILERPWPGATTGTLLSRMQLDVGIAGNSYIRNVGDGTIERLRPDWVTIVSTVQSDVYGRSVRRVIGYVYDPIADTDRDIEYYTVDEVAHWAPIPDPEANWRGMSWITPVLHEVNADLAMSKYRDTYFRRGATPSSIVKYQRRLTSAQKIAVRDSIMARHGGPDNAGSVLVFDQGADFQVIGTPVNEMHAVVQAAGENRMAVAAGVPAIVAGLREGVQSITQMNYTPATQLFINISMRPEWRSMCDSLSTITTVPDGAELWYDVTDVAALQQGEQEAAATMQQQSATVNTLITAGYTPESVISAVSSGDLTLLKHSGRVSVQLFEPGTNEVSDAQ